MKIKVLFPAALFIASRLAAAPLTSTTAVHTKPQVTAPVIAVLSAGTEPTLSTSTVGPLPSGWAAIELSGAQEAYIANRDLGKELDVKVGAPFRTLPKPDGPILSTMQAGDQVEITGYHGRWTQVRLTKKITGYIQGWTATNTSATATSAAPTYGSSTSSTTKSPTPPAPVPTPAPFASAPAAPAAVSGGGGHPAQMVDLGDGGSASLPRTFQGKLVSTRSLLHPRRPYDYQLNDTSGARYAYLDISRLLQTEQIEKYIDHTVSVYGTAKAVPDTKDIVIEVESLQLR